MVYKGGRGRISGLQGPANADEQQRSGAKRDNTRVQAHTVHAGLIELAEGARQLLHERHGHVAAVLLLRLRPAGRPLRLLRMQPDSVSCSRACCLTKALHLVGRPRLARLALFYTPSLELNPIQRSAVFPKYRAIDGACSCAQAG